MFNCLPSGRHKSKFMKARVKATGEIVEVIAIDGDWLFCSDGAHYGVESLEGIKSEIDYWTRLEHQYVGMAMQGMMNNSYLAGEFRKDPNNGIEDMSKIITKAEIGRAL